MLEREIRRTARARIAQWVVFCVIGLLVLAMLAACQPVQPVAHAAAPVEEQQGITIKAENMTGVNRLFGKPVYRYDFAPPPFDNFGMNLVGVYNPDGDQPLPLTAETPDDAILATMIDPFIDELLPKPIAATIDPQLINVPFQDVGTFSAPNLTRSAVPYHLDAPAFAPSQAEPNRPITKGEWFKASGIMNIRCTPQENHVRVEVHNLIPIRLYTIWSIWLDPNPDQPRFLPVPFGGAPNAFVTDMHGDATFERILSYCPFNAATEGIDGKRLAIVDIHLHTDHVAYGAVPSPVLAGYPPGVVLHEQLAWNLGAGTRINGQ